MTWCAIATASVACNDRGAASLAPLPSPSPTRMDAATAASPIATGIVASIATIDADAGPPLCPATPWASYGHDPARTSASEGCAEGPLTVTWKLTRQGQCGYTLRVGRILHVVADESAIFAAVSCGGSPAVMRVTTAGEAGWTFSRADYGRGSWPAIAGGAILSVDDGVFLVDRETGNWRGRELDVWGEPLVVSDRFFVDNTFQLDGAGPFVGAFDASFKWAWRASNINAGKGPKVPRTGGIAYADGVIVHSAAMGARAIPSLAAHDATSGEKRWVARGVWPESAPSIAEGRVFTVERWHAEAGDRLVARSLADGAVQWSRTIAWARGPAPVIAERLVLIHGAAGVRAHDRATGALAWSNPTPRKAANEEAATTMAAAKGSRTLVVTSGPRVVVLRLEDGTEQWSGAVVTGTSATSIGGLTVERPVIVGRTVYVTSDGSLLRLDPK